MPDIEPELTIRGLPLTAEQDASIRHYIKHQKQQGLPVDGGSIRWLARGFFRQLVRHDHRGGDAAADVKHAAARKDTGQRCLPRFIKLPLMQLNLPKAPSRCRQITSGRRSHR